MSAIGYETPKRMLQGVQPVARRLIIVMAARAAYSGPDSESPSANAISKRRSCVPGLPARRWWLPLRSPIFVNRPAAEWGAELQRFLAAAGETRLAATVLLPRDEVIVRALTLPGVAIKMPPARLNCRSTTLHPWGDVEVIWGWSARGRDNI